jgi:hypothetical protein
MPAAVTYSGRVECPLTTGIAWVAVVKKVFATPTSTTSSLRPLSTVLARAD